MPLALIVNPYQMPCPGFKDSIVAGGEQAFQIALVREAEQITGDSVSLFPFTSQIFTPSGLNICQLDAAVIMNDDAIIGSKKTRLLPEHVPQLANSIAVVKSFSQSIPELKMFQGKQIHGACLNER
jgi:hypothetical protein